MKKTPEEKRELSFSQRKSLKPIKKNIQLDSMDMDLKNGLWDILTTFCWDRVTHPELSKNKEIEILVRKLWHDYFKYPIDTIDDWWSTTIKILRGYYFNCLWNEVYDFIEFIANSYPSLDRTLKEEFMFACNSILEREVSAYRFVGGRITQITSEEEITEIEEALKIPISPVNEHLNRALELLSDRKNPDYRNSIKESISAVEAICQRITENPRATLGDALNLIEKQGKVELHGALKKAFSNLYGYTSDAEGIRHALRDESILDFEDAKFMLVSCSAFINYLIMKSSKAGIKLR